MLRTRSERAAADDFEAADADCAPSPQPAAASDAARLAAAVGALAARHPEFSAATGLPAGRGARSCILVAATASGAVLAPEPTLAVLLALMAVPFLMVVALRAVALWHLLAGRARPRPCNARKPPIEPLPLYTVLVPLYREAGVVPHLLRALAAIDYPADRLEVLLIVESVDAETQAALRDATLAPFMRVIVVPDGEPRTKPRALQYALQTARGAYVVVYDAEDVPEPDQLRRALAALHAAPTHSAACRRSSTSTTREASWLTRQFTVEYTALFDGILPTLERLRAAGAARRHVEPFPARGARRRRRLGPLQRDRGRRPRHPPRARRLARRRAAVDDLGGGAADLRVWLGQRTRWLKGWMQTAPPRGTQQFQALTGPKTQLVARWLQIRGPIRTPAELADRRVHSIDHPRYSIEQGQVEVRVNERTSPKAKRLD